MDQTKENIGKLFDRLSETREALAQVKAIVDTMLHEVQNHEKAAHELMMTCRQRHENIDKQLSDLRVCHSRIAGKGEASESGNAMFWGKVIGVGTLGAFVAHLVFWLVGQR